MQAGNEKGQGLAEYALIFAFVVIVVIVLVVVFGNEVGRMYSNIVIAI